MAKVWEALSSLLHRLFRPCPCPPRSAGSLPGPGPSPTRPTGDPQLSRTKLVLPLNLQTTLLQEALGWGAGEGSFTFFKNTKSFSTAIRLLTSSSYL